MNYVSVVYAVVFAFVLIYWQVRGKATFRTRDERHEVSEEILNRRISHTAGEARKSSEKA